MIYRESSLFVLPFMAAAVWYDWRERRIPNWVTGLGLAVGLVTAGTGGFYASGAVGAGLAVAAVLLRAGGTVLLTGGLFALRMVGAGDIKLTAVILGTLGVEQGGAGVAAGMCLGAVWSLVKLLKTGTLIRRLWYFVGYVQAYAQTQRASPYYRKGEDDETFVIPLGACIAAGSGAVVLIRSYWGC